MSDTLTVNGDQNQRNQGPPSTESNYLGSKYRIRTGDLREAKRRREKWGMLTSYDSVSARIFDQAKIPCLLVGDSAAQTVYGLKSTLPVTVDELIPLARAVSSSCDRALVIGDLPFGSYEESPKAALQTAARFMKESQVHAVKLEGGKELARHIELLTSSGVPVMAHIGFRPQSEHVLGGFKVQGRDEDTILEMVEEAKVLEAAGAFACVLELVPSEVGRRVTDALNIPTIGIGAGPHTDAQILVWHDMAGFTAPRNQTGGYLSEAPTASSSLGLSRVPKFVKRFANISETLFAAAKEYASEVSSGVYPAEEHCYK